MGNSNLFGVEVKHFRSNHTLRLRNKLVSIDEPMIMAIVNATPDSFHATSRINSQLELDAFAKNCVRKNVKMIDLGAHSTRPGYEVIAAKEQIVRLKPFLSRLRNKFPELYVSVDTSLPEVARFALENGADLINDVEGGRNFPEIFDVCAEFNAPYILVHSRGNPDALHQKASYENVTADVLMELSCQIQKIKHAGVKDIILDLGFGFSKSLEENYELLKNLNIFHILNFPVLCGISRKSMIYKKLNASSEFALNGTTILNTFALMRNATILRVHDINEAQEIIKLLNIP